jgi:GNAT superfamily N-acetyltransferase
MNQYISTKNEHFKLKFADKGDIKQILSFIKSLAEYEKLSHEMIATEDLLEKYLFGENKAAEVLIGLFHEKPVSMALFFTNFSTFLGRPGIYLEDLYVIPEMRGKGFGKIILSYLAKLTRERSCGRFEWSVLDWNKPAVDFYKSIGAEAMNGWTIQRMSGEALDRLSNQFTEVAD